MSTVLAYVFFTPWTRQYIVRLTARLHPDSRLHRWLLYQLYPEGMEVNINGRWYGPPTEQRREDE